MLSLILEILLAFAKIPYPKSQVNIPVLFILEIFLCKVGFTLYRALKKVSKNLSQKEIILWVENDNVHMMYRDHSFSL